jgi:hypothetical protein
MIRFLDAFWSTEDGPRPSLLRDLRTGAAGALARIGVSLALAAGLVGIAVGFLGIVEMQGSAFSDGGVAFVIGLAGAAWCAGLVATWFTYRKFRRLLRTAFAVIALWMVAIPTGIYTEQHFRRGEEFMIGAIILLAISGTFILITTINYRRVGQTLVDRTGAVNVKCAECGYSMVGLEECKCPECGRVYTVDELISLQDYVDGAGRVRVIEEGSVAPDAPPLARVEGALPTQP